MLQCALRKGELGEMDVCKNVIMQCLLPDITRGFYKDKMFKERFNSSERLSVSEPCGQIFP